MNLSAAALRLMAEKGLTLLDVAEIVAANDVRSDNTNAERQARHRAKKKSESNGVTVTRYAPPNDKDILTPSVQASEPNGSSPSPRPWALPVGVSLQVWNDFLGNRKRKRLGNTPTAWKAFNDDLFRISLQTGIPPPQLIEHAAAKGWGGIYAPEENQRERPDSNPTATALARVQAALRG